MTSRAGKWLSVAVTVIPIAVVGSYIAAHGQSVPFWDEWMEPLDVALKTAEGKLTFADLVRQYNDSRPVFTNLLTAASVHASGWNLKAEMYFNMLLAFLTLLLVASMYQRRDRQGALVVLPIAALLIFSLTQRQSWLWAIQSQCFFLIFFLVAALWVLDKYPPRWLPLGAAALLCFCATFSYANGFLVWFAVLPVLWLLEYRRKSFYLFWLLAAAVSLGLFFFGYVLRGLAERPFPDLLLALKFALAFIGNALVGHQGPLTTSAFVLIAAIGLAGLVGLAVNAAYVRGCHGGWTALAPWIGLAAFVLASGGLAALGRGATRGLAGALANRYVTLSLAFWVAFLALAALAIRESYRQRTSSQAAKALFTTNLAMAVLLSGALLHAGYRSARLRPRVTPSHRACLAAVPATRDVTCLKGLHPVFDPDHPSFQVRSLALEKIDRLAELELGVFSGAMSDEEKRRRIAAMYRDYKVSFADVPDLTVEELLALAGDEVVLVDVREAEERRVSWIPGAVSQQAFEDDAAAYAGKRVVTYCTVGYRSGLYAAELRRQGWEAYNLAGSVLAWTHAGQPLANDDGETRRLHVYGAKWDLAAEGYETEW